MSFYDYQGNILSEDYDPYVTSDYTRTECINAFIFAMNRKATEIGMTSSTWADASGLSSSNRTTARDLMRMTVVACGYPELAKIWNKRSWTIKTKAGRTYTQTSTVTNETLEASYHIFGGKTGHTGANLNLVMVSADANGDWMAGAITTASTEEYRFLDMLALFELADRAVAGEDVSGESIADCTGAIVCHVPSHPLGYDKTFSDFDVLFAQGADTSIIPASTTKVMTAITALDYIDDINHQVTVESEDSFLNTGDVVTFRDILFTMMLPSNNAGANRLAKSIGAKILNTGIQF